MRRNKIIMKHNKILAASKHIGIRQIDSEWLNFIQFLDDTRPKTVLEIGSKWGGSAYTLAHFTTSLICIDIKDNIRNKIKNEIRKRCNLNFIVGNSRDVKTIESVKEILDTNNLKLDLLFIDGDHTYEGARADFDNYSKFVNTGGYVVLHDIVKSERYINKNCLVFKLWEEIKATNNSTIEYCGGEDWAGIGIVRI